MGAEAAQTDIDKNNPKQRIGLALKLLEIWTRIIMIPPVLIEGIESTLK